MRNTVLLTTIINRSKGEKLLALFLENQVPLVFNALGIGTATNEILDYLGLGETEKEIFFSVLTETKAQEILKIVERRIKLYIPGNGISYTVALKSFAGLTALKQLTADPDIDGEDPAEEKKEALMETTGQYELIVAILNRGYSDQVMDAARAAQARGGTVIHVLGTGREVAEKFFNISIAREKDMVLIVTTATARQGIMRAIMAETGVQTKAHAIAFSLPISDIAGIRMGEDD
ncbi:MAG: P-II family nitrogen regulator [Clostridiales bacterium]